MTVVFFESARPTLLNVIAGSKSKELSVPSGREMSTILSKKTEPITDSVSSSRAPCRNRTSDLLITSYLHIPIHSLSQFTYICISSDLQRFTLLYAIVCFQYLSTNVLQMFYNL